MRKRIAAAAAAAIAIGVVGLTAAPANAVNCNSFNQGTGKAFHMAGAEGQGLYKIASQCH